MRIILPERIIFGVGKFDNLLEEIKQLRGNTIGIITSKGFIKRKVLGKVLKSLNNYKVRVYSEVKPEPDMDTCKEIVGLFKDIDTVIGIGGGSVLDVAKYVAMRLGAYKIMVSTTSGTGSEVTHESVLKVGGKKRAFVDDKLVPDVAIVDPVLTYTMPKRLVAITGIDALAHAIECRDSKGSNIITKALAKRAYQVITSNLVNAINGNKNAKNKMALGSLLAGMAFGNSGTTLGHALSYPLSNEGIPHGQAVAMVLPYALEFNYDIADKIFIDELRVLIKDLGLITDIKQSPKEMARVVIKDKKHLDKNIRKVNYKDLVEIFKKVKNER